MKKVLILFMAVLVLCSGCGKKEENNTNTDNNKVDSGAKEVLNNVIKLNYNGVDLIPGEAFDPDALGGNPDIIVLENCAIETQDTVYTYDELEITTNTMSGKEGIYSIYVYDEGITTDEGLTVYDEKSKMESIYGSNYEKENDYIYVYKFENADLKITIDDDTVTEIEYVLVVE